MIVLFKNKPVKNVNVINAILRKMSIENDFDFDNVYVNRDFKYIETIDFNKKDSDFCKTEYKNKIYQVKYFSGCFNPYLVELN